MNNINKEYVYRFRRIIVLLYYGFLLSSSLLTNTAPVPSANELYRQRGCLCSATLDIYQDGGLSPTASPIGTRVTLGFWYIKAKSSVE